VSSFQASLTSPHKIWNERFPSPLVGEGVVQRSEGSRVRVRADRAAGKSPHRLARRLLCFTPSPQA